ncbi:MAG: PEP/pyruvate-binding domain-containing protein, partial [Bacteroidota bacterium]
MKYTYNFGELDNSNVSTVGGKNASLGEMFRQLSSKGINIPDGFASSADAYREYIQQNEIEEKISNTLSEMDVEDSKSLEKTGKKCRDLIMKGDIPKEIREALEAAWDELKDREDSLSSVAVRSSATAEDLPDASFAGQHESYMNITNKKQLLEAWKKCVASLFTDRAIKYREENGFEHMKVALSVGVQKMVRSDKASAGVAFTIDPESGFDKVILINGTWGLGENVVQGTVRTDEFYLYKKAIKEDKKAIIAKNMG